MEDTVAIKADTSTIKSIKNQMITLYDLRDSLKAHIDIYKEKKQGRTAFNSTYQGSFPANPDRFIFAAIEVGNHLHIRRIRNIFYSYMDNRGHLD